MVVISRLAANVFLRDVPFRSTAPLVLISPPSVLRPVPCNVKDVRDALAPIAPNVIPPLPLLIVKPYEPFVAAKLMAPFELEVKVRSAPVSVIAPV